MNGMIIVILIILYFAFKFLKAKNSEDNSGGYSRRPYNAGYPWNRVAPPEDVPERGEDESESYGAGTENEDDSYGTGTDGFMAEATEYGEKAVEVKPLDIKADYKMPDVPAPEAIGLRMPEPMSIPEMKIVIDSDVHVDATMSSDNDKT